MPDQVDTDHGGGVGVVGGNVDLGGRWVCLCKLGFCIVVAVVVWFGGCMAWDDSKVSCR